jgi:LytS/YehU family sensor histidine kinase
MILEMSNKDIVTLSDEIKALDLYLELEQLRFEDKLIYQFDIDISISTETTFIPSMLIQPYIENAIKHGLLHKRNNWLLNITFSSQQEKLIVIIDDNGIGRKRSAELNKTKSKHQSFASVANEKRLSILNKGLQENIGLEITDKLDEHNNSLGTTVKLIIPFTKL